MQIGIDIGGTHVKGVLIGDDAIVTKITRDTQRQDENWHDSISGVYEELKQYAEQPIISVGLSAPGVANEDNRCIAFMPERFKGLEGFIWGDFLGTSVKVLNDAHAALWAEAKWGVGKGMQNVVMLTLGTGIGGGLLIDGKLHQGFMKRAGHLGHVSINANDTITSIAGTPGSLEDAVGEITLAHRSKNRFEHTHELVKAYQAGDTWATFVWLNSVRILSVSIVSFCNAFSPDLVVLAGGVTKAGVDLLEPLQSFLDIYEWRPGGKSTPIKIAEYEDFAGAIGAALYARDHMDL
ncbi:MAG: ROK family protein [Saprospiraceae bacterium]|nr:ROK family protein [Saprospiraceae bacterium]